MMDSYRDLVRLPSAQRSYRSWFLDLADPAREGAQLFHCTTGKDRTGWAAAVLLAVLGADPDVIVDDYLQTNHDLQRATQPVLDRAAAAGIDPALLEPVLTVRTEFLQAAHDEVRTTYGTLQNYLSDGLGLDDEVLQTVRERFIEP